MKILVNKNNSEENTVIYLMEEHGYVFCMLTYYEVENHIMYLSDLNVSESQRYKHIGTEMIKYVIEYAKENGCEYLYLHVLDQNSWICKWFLS